MPHERRTILVRWLETPEHLVAIVDRVGETTLNYRQDRLSGTGAELVGAPGSVAAAIDIAR